MLNLNKEMLTILRQCLTAYKPDLLWVLDQEKNVVIDEKLGNQLREAVTDEFMGKGLRNDSEPNNYGFKLEELIDMIGRHSINRHV